MRYLLFILLITSYSASAQLAIDAESFFTGLKTGASMPEKLLSSRSVVIYPKTITEKELEAIQLSFQETGIDAVAYFEADLLLAGKDVATAFTYYLNQRDIVNIIFLQKKDQFSAFITGFNGKETFVEPNQLAWSDNDAYLAELLKKIHRACSNLKRENFLINEYPETKLPVHVISGRRSEFFAIDLKVDQLAVPKTGNESIDKDLESIFSTYPFKYKLTDPGLTQKELRQKGFFYVLSFIHTRGSVAKEILGYDTTKPESAYVSITYPDGVAQLKNISADTEVYKFYFKHIDSGNVFLGTKWDADVTWQQALKNHLMAFKSELKIN